MYEKFTDRARKVMALANQEAQRFNHEYIGTEHILLGLVKEGTGIAARALQEIGIDLRQIRVLVEERIVVGPEVVMMGKLPQTPGAKHAIKFALEESEKLRHTYIGTEHLLLGLIRQQDGVAAQVLKVTGLSYDQVHAEVVFTIGEERGGRNPTEQQARKALLQLSLRLMREIGCPTELVPALCKFFNTRIGIELLRTPLNLGLTHVKEELSSAETETR